MFYYERKSPGDRETIKNNGGARSKAPWVRKFGYPREILEVRWRNVRPPARPSVRTTLFYIVWSLQPAFNLMIDVHIMVVYKKKIKETNFTQHENFKAVVRKWKMLAASTVKMRGSEK